MSLWKSKSFRLFLTFLIIYSVFINVEGWNENSRFDLTRAIVDHGTFKTDKYANNTGDRAFFDGHYYSDKMPGSSFIAVPVYFVYKYTFGTPSIHSDFYHVNSDSSYLFMVFFIIMFTSALFSALTVVLIFKISKYFTNRLSHRYILAVGYGFGTIAFSQATLFLGHAIATFFAFASFYLIFKMRQEKKGDYYFLAGVLGGIAFLVDMYALFVIFGLFILVLLTHKFSFIIKFGSGVLIFVLVFFLYNQICFDNSFNGSYSNVDTTIFSSLYYELDLYNCVQNLGVLGSIERLFGKIFDIPRQCYIHENFYYVPKLNMIFHSDIEIFSYNETGTEWLSNKTVLRNDVNNTFEMKYSFSKNLNKSNKYQIYVSYYENEEKLWFLMRDYNLKGNNVSSFDYGYTGLYIVHNCPIWPQKYNISSNFTTFSCKFNNYIIPNGSLYYESWITGNTSILNITEDKELGLIYHLSQNVDIKTKKYVPMFNIFVRLMFYPYRGLFFYNPILILSIIGFFYSLKKFPLESLSILLIVVGILTFLLHSYWWSGSSFGPRFFLICMPFLFFFVIFAIEKLNINLILVIVILSILVNLSGHQVLEQKVINVYPYLNFDSKYWSNFDTFKPIGNPLFEHYISNTLKFGPKSIILNRLVKPFPYFIFLLPIIFLIWKKRFVS